MLRSIDASSDRFLDSLRSLNSRMDKLQGQISNGKRLTTPSDDPDSVTNLLQAHSDLARLEQTQTNLGRVKTEVDAAEGALSSAVSLFDRVRTLGMTGASGVQNALTRRGIADELASIMERMVGLANTQVAGRYIFSGDRDQGAAYDIDFSQTPPWTHYQGTPATRKAMHPTGVAFAVSKDAQEIFDNPDPANNVMQAIDNLRQALLTNDDAAMKAALEPLARVSAHLNSMLTFYGNVQSQLSEATGTASKMKLRLDTEKAGLEDADITSAIVELQSLKFTQQAALEVRGQIQRNSLFDYLG